MLNIVTFTGRDLVRFTKAGCINLEHKRDEVDLLNVFPVPDGDTGTNMYLTLLSTVKEGEKHIDEPLGKVARAISMGSLMGARGNSGVILSQVFRGMARELEGKDRANSREIARALKTGSETAYKAVMKPVEGTILTVIKEIARVCEHTARHEEDIVATLWAGIEAGHTILKKTPSMLPILKEAGVVDAGGQGLLYFLEGAVAGLALEKDINIEKYREKYHDPVPAKDMQSAGQLDYVYCTEILIRGSGLDEHDIRDHLTPLGDSLLVVGDDELVKVHIHTNHPGKVLESSLQFGSLSDIKINNMLEEIHQTNNYQEDGKGESRKQIGLVAVAAGPGIIKILYSLGVDQVVEGGPTMNPSTEELYNACEQVPSDNIIIFPNNSNVILAARQVDFISDKKVSVVPTKSVLQAITALIAYDPDGNIDDVSANMNEEIKNITYGEITYAVRDSTVNGLDIREGDIIGLIEDKVRVRGDGLEQVVLDLLGEMVTDDYDLITLFYGNGLSSAAAETIKARIVEIYPELEVEMYYGGQAHYAFLISVE